MAYTDFGLKISPSSTTNQREDHSDPKRPPSEELPQTTIDS